MRKILFVILFMSFSSDLFSQTFYSWRYREHATACPSVTDGKIRDLCYEIDDDTLYKCEPDSGDCSGTEWKKIGNVSGPSSSTDNALARFDLATGRIIQNSVGILGDTGSLSGILNFSQTGFHDIQEISEPTAPSSDNMRIFAEDNNTNTVIKLKSPDGTVSQFARDQIFIAKNTQGSSITKRQAVYISGGVGASGTPEVKLAKADSDTTMPVAGIVLESSISNNGFGRIMAAGKMENVSTTGFSEGDRLFISDVTAGLLTATQPSHPSLRQRVALVINVHASEGTIFVYPVVIRGDHEGTNKTTWKIGDTLNTTATLDTSLISTAGKNFSFPNENGTLCTTGSICSGYENADNLTTGTVAAARVGAGHIDASTEIADDIIDSQHYAANSVDDEHMNTTATKFFSPQSAKLTGGFVVFTPGGGDATTQGAQIDAGDGNWRLLFDSTIDEGAVWQWRLPDNWGAHSEVNIPYSMTSGTANKVEYEVAVMCVSDGDAADIGTASFANVALGSATVPGTAGYLDEISITVTDDSCAAGDMFWLFLSTDANDGSNDDATGDREVQGVEYEYIT
jgi:hypothetical protein